ncbi:hypothetical protein V1264_020885 [Littorina saxatilis]|uniref:C-type lectin domain-containing protein n=3 Tax=Littorina saxatilis TaxID=31220 RepID=A0AAN9BC26_9CAEN
MRNVKDYYMVVVCFLSVGSQFTSSIVLSTIDDSNTTSSVLPHVTCGKDYTRDPAYRMTSFTQVTTDDVIFTEQIIFSVSTASKLDCARVCARHLMCVTFTFIRLTSKGICKGHNDVMDVADSDVASPGKMYINTKALLCSQLGEGYTLQADWCIRPFNESLTADDATLTCSQHGDGHLTHLKTLEDVQLMDCIRAELGWRGYIWLGADDKQVEGEFRWSDGTLVLPDPPVTWILDDSESVSPQDCVGLHSSNVVVDRRCGDVHLAVFVCQIDM